MITRIYDFEFSCDKCGSVELRKQRSTHPLPDGWAWVYTEAIDSCGDPYFPLMCPECSGQKEPE